MRQIRIFVSYSHRDEQWVQDGPFGLIPWLAQQLRRHQVAFWFDPKLQHLPGEDYRQRIQREIEEADYAILLLSMNFVSSDFIGEFELPRIRERVRQGKMGIIPILVGPVDWEGEKDFKWLTARQILPGKPTPLVEYTKDAAEWAKVQVQIFSAIRNRLAETRQAEPVPPPESTGIPASVTTDRPKQRPGPAGVRRKHAIAATILSALLFAVVVGLVRWSHRPRIDVQSDGRPNAVQARVASPSSLQALVVGPSANWHPQTHPDCQAVHTIERLPDGQTVEIRADFSPDRAETSLGEAIVFLTQGAAKPGDLTTFELHEVSMDIEMPPALEVSFFLKDDSWENADWSLPLRGVEGWQHHVLNTENLAPTWRSRGFDSRRGIALGWKFWCNTCRGPAVIRIRNVRLVVHPTNLLPPVQRCLPDQYVRHCGVDLPDGLGDHDFGKPLGGGPHQGLSNRRAELHALFDALGAARVNLVQYPLFRDLSAGVTLDAQGRIAELDELVSADLNALLAETLLHPGMQVWLVLFDGTVGKRWPNLIVNAEDRVAFCRRIIEPLLSRYASSEQIAGVELTCDLEAIAEANGEPAARAFATEMLGVFRRVKPRWKTALGYRSRDGMDRFGVSGFDVYTFVYDPVNQRHEFLKVRRDAMSFPATEAPVFVIARFPVISGADHTHQGAPYTSLVLQDAFDYGYAGVVFSEWQSHDHRGGFQGREAGAFATWVAETLTSAPGPATQNP